MTLLLDDFRLLLENAPTSWHAALELSNRLASKEFIPLEENEKWELQRGKKYFVQRGGSLCAFSVPTHKTTGSIILAAHTDSPALKLKPRPETKSENMTLFGVEVYGAPLLASWVNRDLGLAGRVIVSDEQGNLEEKLVFIDEAPLVIPQLAIHFDRDVNEKGLVLNKQDHLSPIACLNEMDGSYFESLIKRYVSFHNLVSFDLFLVPLEESRFLGQQGEMLASYRIDNLASCHAACVALAVAAQTKHTLQMGFFWDHEEIGSRSSEGASSPFFNDVLKRIALNLKLDEEELFVIKDQSLCVSIDMAHAFNPNYANKYDANHHPLLGKGIAIKCNADQKYASNAKTSAIIIEACHKLGLSYQNFVTRSDIPCGSTVGPLFATASGIQAVDIGSPQLSMHSSREIMACSDHIDMCQLLTYLLENER